MSRIKNSREKQTRPERRGVTIQPTPILPNACQRILVTPVRRRPIPSTAPTTAWELDMGTRGQCGSPESDN
ncbi:uncharacterized protein METZ01_LOCUS80005 [marine metagenome]|uniref:Uncharacterized protein n=1 Tax=marine metagenome TaxID=408172 RepID=A0A381UHG5_9ZZZZ